MIQKLALPLLIAVAFIGPAQAQVDPSFDCAKAETPVENAICADEALAEEDHAIAVAFQSLVERSDAGLAEVLRADQRAFIAIRDEAFGLGHIEEERRLESLLSNLQYRAEFLNWINVAPPDGLEGTWRNAHGELSIARAADGLVMEANVADQVTGSWVCSVEGPLVMAKDGTGRVQTEEGQIRLSPAAGYLDLADANPNGTQGYCGHGGWMAGPYFFVGAE